MFKTKFLLISLLLMPGIHLSAQETKIDSSRMLTLRIDPEAARGAAVSQIFDQVDYIPLETNKESLFGTIAQLEVIDDKFIIFDLDTKAVLIFTTAGKYLGKIDGSKLNKNGGDDNKSFFYGFSIMKENGADVITISTQKNKLYYDLQGKLLKKTVLKEQQQVAPQTIAIANSKYRYSFYWTDPVAKDSVYYKIAFFEDEKPLTKYFKVDNKRYENDVFYSVPGIKTRDITQSPFMYDEYSYNIYKIDAPKLYLQYRMIFPASNSLPKDFISNPMYVGRENRLKYFDANREVIYGIGNVIQQNNNLFFKTGSWGGGMNRKNAFMYNLKTTELISINNIEPDSSSYFLPVTDSGKGYGFINNGFTYYDGKYLYTEISSLALFGFKDESQNKKAKLNPVLEQYFKTQSIKSNPVIIRLKSKQD